MSGMEISHHGLSDLMLAAIKAEIESRELYSAVASRAASETVKERLDLLAREEARHEAFLRRHFEAEFPGKAVALPDRTKVPLPVLRYVRGMTPIDTLESAVGAEAAAADFYSSLALRKGLSAELSRGLGLLANMERSHFEILRLELESMRTFEGFDVYGELERSFDGLDDDARSFDV